MTRELQVSLHPNELKWSLLYPVLLERGYQLPERYTRHWHPSALSSEGPVDPVLHEDALARSWTPQLSFTAMDAIRLSDNSRVFLKMVKRGADADSPDETGILHHFSSPALGTDPYNHFIPLLDIIELPAGLSFLVFPYLSSNMHFTWVTPLEALPYLRQLLEGLAHMHENRVAHRDIHSHNQRFDPSPLYDEGNVAVNPLRDIPPTTVWDQFPSCSLLFSEPAPRLDRIDLPGNALRAYYLDAGNAIQVDQTSSVPLKVANEGAAWRVPEQGDKESDNMPHDPFLADVWNLGKTFLEAGMIQDHIPFALPFLMSLMWPYPEHRPTAQQALALYSTVIFPEIRRSSWHELLRPIWYPYWQLNGQKTLWQRLKIRWQFLCHYARVVFKALVLGKGHKLLDKETALLAHLDERFDLRECIGSIHPMLLKAMLENMN